MWSDSDADSFEFDVPEELKPWIEFQENHPNGFNTPKVFHYILEKGKIKKADLFEMAKWFEENSEARIVDKTELDGGVSVSTVFLCIDHNFLNFAEPWEGKKNNHRPILFETMIFGGEHDQYQVRYATFAEAKKGHWEAVDIAKGKKIQ